MHQISDHLDTRFGFGFSMGFHALKSPSRFYPAGETGDCRRDFFFDILKYNPEMYVLPLLRECFCRQWNLIKPDRVYGFCWTVNLFLIYIQRDFVATLPSYGRGVPIAVLAHTRSMAPGKQTRSRFWWVLSCNGDLFLE